jgi:hypothetical protein
MSGLDTPLLQLFYLVVLSIPIACISWTVVREEVFREIREHFISHSKKGKTLIIRKFFFLFTCEYCFSHYITIAILIITDFKMLFADWRGYLISGFSLVWLANIYMGLYNLIRLDIKKENLESKLEEKKLAGR